MSAGSTEALKDRAGHKAKRWVFKAIAFARGRRLGRLLVRRIRNHADQGQLRALADHRMVAEFHHAPIRYHPFSRHERSKT